MPPQLDELLARVDQCGAQAREGSTQFRELHAEFRQAIAIAQLDPEMSLARARKVLEFVVRDVYDERLKPKQAGTQPLEGLLQTLVKEGQFPNRLVAYADMVRELGNVGVHSFGPGVSSQDVLNSLESLLPIVEWYFEQRQSPGAPVAESPAAATTATAPVAAPPQTQVPASSAAEGPASTVVNPIAGRPQAAAAIKPPPHSRHDGKQLPAPSWKIAAAAAGVLAVGVIMYRAWALGHDNSTVETLIPASGTPAQGKKPETPLTVAKARSITNSIGMRLTLIRAGEFWMGSPEGEADASMDEHPAHQVHITKPFYLGTYSVTKGEFAEFVAATNYQTEAEQDGNGGFGFSSDRDNMFKKEPAFNWRNTGFKQTDKHPVVNVSWNDAAAFCKWLSQREQKIYRLPTEAEWEYACRAGTETSYFCGDNSEDLAKYANVADATFLKMFPVRKVIGASDGYAFTAPVGSYQPNPFGLYDMLGNSWQWCADWYGKDYYENSRTVNPQGPDAGADCVRRGGGFESAPSDCRCANRDRRAPAYRTCNTGFRVVREP